jgi:type IV pilus assembly protein PilX
MSYASFNATGRNTQGGAALVVGLLLLVVITLLAIGGMNSVSVELAMAGNTQYQQRAFEAAEAGIETRLGDDREFNPQAAEPDEETDVPVADDPRLATDTYSYRMTPDLGGQEQLAISGNSLKKFSSYHFTIQSTGASGRKARTTHVQGVATINSKGDSLQDPNAAQTELE